MYKSYRMSNTEQVATVGPQMVAGIRYLNEVAAPTTTTADRGQYKIIAYVSISNALS